MNGDNLPQPMQPAQEKPKGGGLFGGKPKKTVTTATFNVVNEINNVGRRLRILEERYTNLRRKTQVTEQNILRNNKKLNTEIKTINTDINEVKRDINEIRNKIDLIVKEIMLCAKKEDLKVLEKYINMWNPVKFVTQGEVEKIVRDIIQENK